uniref:Uncharacterized protein n=1 Tax=Human herpesvirus 2 TaxID=10310 RepID=A0A481TD52_HHV2|nr:hypothetical protein [Human alphaherpesvirus 2]
MYSVCSYETGRVERIVAVPGRPHDVWDATATFSAGEESSPRNQANVTPSGTQPAVQTAWSPVNSMVMVGRGSTDAVPLALRRENDTESRCHVSWQVKVRGGPWPPTAAEVTVETVEKPSGFSCVCVCIWAGSNTRRPSSNQTNSARLPG